MKGPWRWEPSRAMDQRIRVTMPAFGLVVVILAAAAVALALGSAERTHGEALASSERYSVQAAGIAARYRQWASAEYQLFLRKQADETSAATAVQHALFATGERQSLFNADRVRWRAAAKSQLDAMNRIEAQMKPPVAIASYGPRSDPNFPNRFFAASNWEAVREQAFGEAEQHYAAGFESKSSKLEAALGFFAIASYLFGSCLTLHEWQPRVAFLLIGALTLLVGAGWGADAAFAHVSRPNATAIRAYTEGHVKLLTGRFGPALVDLKRAVAVDPSLASARADVAAAVVEQGARGPGLLAGYFPRVTQTHELQLSIKHLRSARRLQRTDAQVVRDLGLQETLFGLATDRVPSLKEGERDSLAAASMLGGSDAEAEYGAGLAMLALGDAGATIEYQSAIDDTLHLSTGGLDGASQEMLVANALSELQVLSGKRPALDRDVASLKGQIVGAVAAGQAHPPEAPRLESLEPGVTPNGVTLRATIPPSFRPDADHLSFQWWYEGAGRQWVVLPTLSGAVAVNGKQTALTWTKSSLGTASPECLPSGNYLLEAYDNGQPVRTPTQLIGPLLTLTRAPRLRLATCLPPGSPWDPQSSLGGVSAFFDIVTQAPGTALTGIMLLRSAVPTGLQGLGSLAVLRRIFGSSEFPAITLTLNRLSPLRSESVPGSGRGEIFGYDRSDGDVRLTVVTDRRVGEILVALVFGPSGAFQAPGSTYNAALHSFTSLGGA